MRASCEQPAASPRRAGLYQEPHIAAQAEEHAFYYANQPVDAAASRMGVLVLVLVLVNALAVRVAFSFLPSSSVTPSPPLADDAEFGERSATGANVPTPWSTIHRVPLPVLQAAFHS